MEWQNDNKENMEVDIGFMSRMEVVSSVSSMKQEVTQKDITGKETIAVMDPTMPIKPLNQTIYDRLVEQYKWTDQIDMDEAHSRLEKAFYPFKEVNILKCKIQA
jgi:hypothetical protein